MAVTLLAGKRLLTPIVSRLNAAATRLKVASYAVRRVSAARHVGERCQIA
jgi:hypothetical protein